MHELGAMQQQAANLRRQLLASNAALQASQGSFSCQFCQFCSSKGRPHLRMPSSFLLPGWQSSTPSHSPCCRPPALVLLGGWKRCRRPQRCSRAWRRHGRYRTSDCWAGLHAMLAAACTSDGAC